MDAKGNLYGTTIDGGAYGESDGGWGHGTVFELSPPATAGGKWTETVLHSFGATCNDGVWPYAGLIMDAKGNLYGTTWAGGGQYYGDGTAFELSPPTKKDGPWTETLLHEFGATSTSPWELQGGLIMDAKGNLYGTTYRGGAYDESDGLGGDGTVFELSPPATAGGKWTRTVLFSFGPRIASGGSLDGQSP